MYIPSTYSSLQNKCEVGIRKLVDGEKIMKITSFVSAFTYCYVLPNKAVLVEIFFNINESVCTFIRKTRVSTW